MKRIAVDFDGTIARVTQTGALELIEGSREAMIELSEKGYEIVIYTCRISEAPNVTTMILELERFLSHHEVPFHSIYPNPKLIADVYLDDRAVEFDGDWRVAKEKIIRKLGDR